MNRICSPSSCCCFCMLSAGPCSVAYCVSFLFPGGGGGLASTSLHHTRQRYRGTHHTPRVPAGASLLLPVRNMRAPSVAVGCLGLLLGASSSHQTAQPHRGGGMGRWPLFMHGHGLKHSCVLVQVLVCSSRWLAPPAAVQEPHGSSHGPVVLVPGPLVLTRCSSFSRKHTLACTQAQHHQHLSERSYLQCTVHCVLHGMVIMSTNHIFIYTYIYIISHISPIFHIFSAQKERR